jgi:hypothetical protein
MFVSNLKEEEDLERIIDSLAWRVKISSALFAREMTGMAL